MRLFPSDTIIVYRAAEPLSENVAPLYRVIFPPVLRVILPQYPRPDTPAPLSLPVTTCLARCELLFLTDGYFCVGVSGVLPAAG